MDCFTEIFSNALKQIQSRIHRNSSKEEAIHQEQALKSAFPINLKNPNSNGEACSSTQSWNDEYNLRSEKIKSFDLLLFLLSFCSPFTCSKIIQPNPCSRNPLVVQLPCDVKYVTPKKEEKPKPVGFVTAQKDVELHNGELVFGCTCGRRNGLNGEDCRRSCCQNNPGCVMQPPKCWPQFKEPPEPPKPKMICIPVDVVYYDPCSKEFMN